MSTQSNNQWSQEASKTSDSLDVKSGVFKKKDPRQIAQSLKESAARSHKRRSTPFRSAMSMLTFYINRAGDQLPDDQRQRLEQAKDELRELYGKPRKH